MTKRQIRLWLIMESIAYHQLHLQKMYEQQSDKVIKRQIECEHEELCEISKLLIKELDKFDKEN